MFSSAYDLLILALVVFIILGVGRELNCWYWKINERLKVEQEIRDTLKTIAERLPS